MTIDTDDRTAAGTDANEPPGGEDLASTLGAPPWSRRRVKRATIVTHRWLSIVLGIVLLIVTTSGAAVVYAPEWTRWTNSSVFHTTRSDRPVDVIDAMKIVDRAHPDFEAGSVNVYGGLYEILSADDDAHPGFYGVDPGSGRITGYVNPNRGVMAFMEQVHECFFTCAEYPAYLKFLDKPMPTLGMQWLKDVTISSFIEGMAGLLLLFLAVSGVWLWWPTRKRFRDGFRVRMGKGRFKRDYDLHKVIGMVALPFLLVWGFTGASFEFHWVNTAWYSVTGGRQPADDTFASRKVSAKTPDITAEQALATAQRIAGPDAKLKNLFPPEPDDATGAYDVWFAVRLDPYAHGSYPGQYEVEIDRHDAGRTHIVDYGTAETASNKLLDVWGSSLLHYGQTLNAWWRLFWFGFGLTPLALAVTGLSTWLYKRGAKKRRSALGAASATVP